MKKWKKRKFWLLLLVLQYEKPTYLSFNYCQNNFESAPIIIENLYNKNTHTTHTPNSFLFIEQLEGAKVFFFLYMFGAKVYTHKVASYCHVTIQ